MKRTRSETESGVSVVTWKRTGNKDDDLMHLYETGQMHDCTIKVGSDLLGYQEFQCHKVILGGASSVLQTILYEQENQDPKQHFLIKDVAPNVFDLAMKFIYGGLKDFGDSICAINVYKFAHKIRVEHLLEAAMAYLGSLDYSAAIVFALYNFSLLFEKKKSDGKEQQSLIMKKCWDKINTSPEKAFGSPCWLALCQVCVMQVLQSDKNNVAEPILFRAALHWALQTRDPDCSMLKLNEPEVKAKLNSVLKCIRFGAFSVETFLSIFEKSGTLAYNLLSAEDKLKILSCIATKSPEGMPLGFCRSMETRKGNGLFNIKTPYKIQEAQPGEKAELFTLCFSVDKDVSLATLVFFHPGSDLQAKNPVKVTLVDPSENGKELPVQTELMRHCLIKHQCCYILKANCLYKLHLPRGDEDTVLNQVAKLSLGAECVRHPNGLNVTFYSQTLHALVTHIIFAFM